MKLLFCPECAKPLTKKSTTAYTCSNGHPYWNNPRLAVGVALLKDNQILFAKRGNEPKKGKYDLPGGFGDYGENVFEAAIRELQEEAGITIHNPSMIDSFANLLYEENMAITDVIVIVTEWEGDPIANDDVAALEWKPIAFINSDQFAWNYHGLAEKLQSYASR